MATFPHHERLRLVNFTAFADASFEWSPGINAIIGTNGTGKTHLLKILYTFQSQRSSKQLFGVHRNLLDVFKIDGEAELLRFGTKNRKWDVSGGWDAEEFWRGEWNEKDVEPETNTGLTITRGGALGMPRPIFIPAVDMMAHTRKFVATYDRYQIDFDQTHRDIVSALLSPPLRDQSHLSDLLKPISNMLGGEIGEEGERFYLRTQHGRQSITIVAEGLRKIATLYTLIKNGYLCSGDTLFWDEPEANLSPVLMDKIVSNLLTLACSGVQIFLTSHSYFILKELDLQSKEEDHVRYFGLYTTDDTDGTQVEAVDDFTELQHNPIMEQFGYVYDREVTRATGRTRRK